MNSFSSKQTDSHFTKVSKLKYGMSKTESWLTKCEKCSMLDIVIFECHSNSKGMQETTRFYPYGIQDSNSGLKIERANGYVCCGCSGKRQHTQIQQIIDGEYI